MTKESLAQQLNGREYLKEITKAEQAEAKKHGLVVMFGYSDDNAEFRGAIHDEISCYEGGELWVAKTGPLDDAGDHRCDCNWCGYSEAKSRCKKIAAAWNSYGYSWTYRTDIPHAKFDILEEGEKFCRGIVFELKNL